MNDTKQISQNQAGEAIKKGQKVYARLADGRTDRIMQIQFVNAIGTMKTYRIEDEIQYFYQYVEITPMAA